MNRCTRFILFSAFIAVCASASYAVSTDSRPVYLSADADTSLEKTKKPQFSAERGLYSSPFDLTLQSSTEGAEIFYTVDGTSPEHSETASSGMSPVTLRVDPESDELRGVTPGFVVRAFAAKAEMRNSRTVTHTYLFADRVADLSPDRKRPDLSWPAQNQSGNNQWIDYGMDPDITEDNRYENLIDDALKDIPTISLVTDLGNLFDPDSGIYMNANRHGDRWERSTSVELLNPDGSEGFQIDAGIRIRGGWSRHPDNPKHAFRLFFREKYGDGKLNYPLFGDEGTDSFDKVDLRTTQNYSWSYKSGDGKYNTMTRDVFSRDLQREMGQAYTRSRYYHLYINGLYWGIFQTEERPEARYAASYYGGSKEDYDVIKANIDENYHETGLEATDGFLDSWRDVWNYTRAGFKTNQKYFEIQGLNADGTVNTEHPRLVDVENLADYALTLFYTGNFDAPCNVWGKNKNAKNFFCIYNRNGNDGYRFMIHDSEHSIRTDAGPGPGTIGLHENRVNIGFLNTNMKMVVTNFNKFHPLWLHFKMAENEEFLMLMADRAYKFLFNHGIMTPEKATELFLSRTRELDLAIIAESARWGDSKMRKPRTKDDDWVWAVNNLVENYFPYRTDIVIDQLKEVGWYPDIDPPVYKANDTEILDEYLKTSSSLVLQLTNPNQESGDIYYTTDGSDPRNIGGDVGDTAVKGADACQIHIGRSTTVKSRVKDGDVWSALHELLFIMPDQGKTLRITEIHYHPSDEGDMNDGEYEFIELKNLSTRPLSLGKSQFSDGIEYSFSDDVMLEPGGFIVLASNQIAFRNRYGFLPFDEYEGQLNNGGERIVLNNAAGDTSLACSYDDESPWPAEADGAGYSLVSNQKRPCTSPDSADYWTVSSVIHGSPGADDGSSPVRTIAGQPGSNQLFPNYPNPFNPETCICYQIDKPAHVEIRVLNILGKEVALLVDEKQLAGQYSVNWQGKDNQGLKVSSGMFFVELKAGDLVQRRKMSLVR